MYDNLKIWVHRFDVEEEKFINLLNNLTIPIVLKKTGEIIGGKEKLRNLTISVFESGVKIIGSISRFYFGESGVGNLFPLNYHDTQKAIEELSDILGIDISVGYVNMIEFGNTFAVTESIEEYLKRLGEYPKIDRISLKANSLYYQHKGQKQPKQLIFYDKKADCRAKGYLIPPQFENTNLLKYELTLKGKAIIAKHIGKELRVCDLYDKSIFYKFLGIYINYYKNIQKSPLAYNLEEVEIKTQSHAVESLFSILLNNSDVSTIPNYIAEIKRLGCLGSVELYRLKKKLNTIKSKTTQMNGDVIINELNSAILNCDL